MFVFNVHRGRYEGQAGRRGEAVLLTTHSYSYASSNFIHHTQINKPFDRHTHEWIGTVRKMGIIGGFIEHAFAVIRKLFMSAFGLFSCISISHVECLPVLEFSVDFYDYL